MVRGSVRAILDRGYPTDAARRGTSLTRPTRSAQRRHAPPAQQPLKPHLRDMCLSSELLKLETAADQRPIMVGTGNSRPGGLGTGAYGALMGLRRPRTTRADELPVETDMLDSIRGQLETAR